MKKYNLDDTENAISSNLESDDDLISGILLKLLIATLNGLERGDKSKPELEIISKTELESLYDLLGDSIPEEYKEQAREYLKG